MKRKTFKLALIICALAGQSLAQGVRYSNTVFSTGGFPFATIRVCTEPATGTPCTPLASVFSDPGLSVPLANPFPSDANGNFSFFASPATTYHVQVSGVGLTTFDIPYITLPGAGGIGTGTVTSVGFQVPTGFNVTGSPVVVAGTLGFTMPVGWTNGDLLAGTGVGSVGRFAIGLNGQCLTVASGSLAWGTCGSGSVSSVGLAVPSGFTVSGSPVTSSGSLTLGMPTGWVAGDLLVGTGPGAVGRLALGSISQCLVNSGGSIAWGSCATGSLVTNPVASQTITQPAGTTFSTNNTDNIRYVAQAGSPFNWSQVQTGVGITGAQTLTFTTCPLGIFGTDTTSYVAVVNAGVVAETDILTGGGTCAPGSAGTIKFTMTGTYTNPTIASASAGIQEAIIDAETNGTGTVKANWKIKLSPTNPPNTTFYPIYARVTLAGAEGELDGSNSNIDCESTESCFYLTSGTFATKIHDMRFASKTIMAGAAVTNTDCGVTLSNTATVTSTLNPPVGSTVDLQLIDENFYWGPHVVTASSGVSFQYADSTCNGGGIKASHATPGNAALLHAFIRDNGNANEFYALTLDTPAWATGLAMTHGIMVENDQMFNLHDSDLANGTGYQCTANYCGSAIYNPGGFVTGPAVGHVDRVQISLQCGGNGIQWWGGNTLKVSDSVVQGFQQFGVQGGQFRGGFGMLMMDNVYQETGSCSNPLFTQAGLGAVPARSQAGASVLQGVINFTQTAPGTNPGPVGQESVFVSGGAIVYQLWAVARDVTAGSVSMPLAFGQAAPPNGSNFTIAHPRIVNNQDVINYDILVTVGSGYSLSAPIGTGTWGLLTAQPQCSGLVCTYTTNLAALTAPSSYTGSTNPAFLPGLNGWPGGVVLGSGGVAYLPDAVGTNVSKIVTTAQNYPTVFSTRCGGATPGVYIGCLTGNSSGNNNPQIGATLLQSGPGAGGGTGGHAGRLNFFWGPAGSTINDHLIDFVNNNPAAVLGDSNHRPVADALDTYLGLDDTAAGKGSIGLAMGASKSLSWYIGNVGDGTNWKERLTTSLKSFKVPISTTGSVTSGGSAGVLGNIQFNCGLTEPTASANEVGVGVAPSATCATPYLNLFPAAPAGDTQNYFLQLAKDGLGNMVGSFIQPIANLTPLQDVVVQDATHVVSEPRACNAGQSAPGTDICDRIHTCYLAGSGNRAGTIDARGYPVSSVQACNSNPFAGANRSGVLLLGAYTIATSRTWITPQKKFRILGEGQESPLQQGNLISNENTNLQPCLASGSPTGCTAGIQQPVNQLFVEPTYSATGTSSSTTATLTTTTAHNYTYTSGTCPSSNCVASHVVVTGCDVVGYNSGGANPIYFSVLTGTTASTVKYTTAGSGLGPTTGCTVQAPPRLHGDYSAPGSGIANPGLHYALIALGGGNNPTGYDNLATCGTGPVGADWSFSAFGSTVEDVGFDMQGIAGMIGLYSGNIQERGGARRITFNNYNGVGAGRLASTDSNALTCTESGTTATCTSPYSHLFANGDTVVVSGVTPGGYNGTFVITAVTATTFSYTAAGGLGNSSVSGIAHASEGVGLMFDRNSWNLNDKCSNAAGNGGPSHFTFEDFYCDASPAVATADTGVCAELAGAHLESDLTSVQDGAGAGGLAQFGFQRGTIRGLNNGGLQKSAYGFRVFNYDDGLANDFHFENLKKDPFYLTGIGGWTSQGWWNQSDDFASSSGSNNAVCHFDVGTNNNRCSMVRGASGANPAGVRDEVFGCPTAPCVVNGSIGGNPVTDYIQGSFPPAPNSESNVVAVTASNPTAATDTQLMEIPLPAAYLDLPMQTFIVHGAGVLSTTAASVPQVTITAKLCSVSGCGSGTVTPLGAIQSTALNTTAVTNATWSYTIGLTASTIGNPCNFIAKSMPGLVIELGNATTVPDSIFVDSLTAVTSPNQNCNNALFLDFFVQQSATGASNSYKQLVGVIR